MDILSETKPDLLENSIFTIVGGTTIPDRAAIVRAECREGSLVELRTAKDCDARGSPIEVWLECGSLLGLLKVWKRIGHVPDETAAELVRAGGEIRSVVARGTVKSIYAPVGRGEAVVTLQIRPRTGAQRTLTPRQSARPEPGGSSRIGFRLSLQISQRSRRCAAVARALASGCATSARRPSGWPRCAPCQARG